MGAVATRKVRIINNDYSFGLRTSRHKRGGLNSDTVFKEIPRCLCREALPKVLDEIMWLRVKYPSSRILLSKAAVTEAFRNVSVAPEHAKKIG